MDVLTDVLSTMKISSALYACVDATEPWGMAIEVHRAIKFCLVARGSCWLVPQDDAPLGLEEGDFILTTPGARYTLCDAVGTPSRPLAEILEGSRGIRQTVRIGGGGASTRLLKGIVTFGTPDISILSGLPPVLVIRHEEAQNLGFDVYLERLGIEAEDPSPGAQLVANWLGAILVVHAVRASVASDRGKASGWWGALSDRRIASTLEAMHEDVARRWSVRELAQIAGMSRSSFAEGFRLRVGKPPLEYLADWRMYRAKGLLTEQTISWVASQLGYGSETAFSKAFKNRTGTTPSEFRRSQASSVASVV